MSYCETCTFWGPVTYSKAKMICSCPKLCEEYDAEAFADDALTYSYQESGCFYSGPKFGCVHHKEKG